MKRKMLSLLSMLLIGTVAVFAQSKTEKFEVKGNCGMCEKRIEKAANSVEGVSKADWNKETEMMTVTFDEGKTNVHKVHMAIAKAGHDTKMHKASDEAYEKLPGCCKYDRTESKKDSDDHHGHQH
ncbi:heavy-metal-associated domain-containing protein [Marinilabilia rubra]|uniref:ATPase n=1 Tax=Marinilabilia rubra TaxID=2162893 RepID=A0A2U2B371_9BACT|nr:cation transporter [Marinilabilia rubra]PWD97511.1 ATPase [Marinilabilia rubra]